MILCFFCLLPSPAAAGSELVLLHFEPGPTRWTKGVESGLAQGAQLPVREVFLDTGSLDEDDFDAVYQDLSGKQGNDAVLGVVADGEVAFAFARKYGADLFPGAPLVFCSMPPPDPAVLSSCGECTGVPVQYDVQESVDLIFSLQPETRLVVAVSDGTPATAPLEAAARKAMAPYMDRAQLMFPGFEPGDETGLDLKMLGDTLASVPASGAVLLLGFDEDREGNPVTDEALAEVLRTRSVSPVYVLRDAWSGSGVVGGWVVSAEDVGRDAAALMLRLRNGEPAGEMLPRPTRPRLRLDGTVLARFGLQPPERAEVKNLPAPEAAAEPVVPVTGLAWAAGLALVVGLLALWRARARK